MPTSKTRQRLIGFGSIILALAIWKLVSLKINSNLILPGPESVLLASSKLFVDLEFLRSMWGTLFRGIISFIISCALGGIIGVVSGLSPMFAAAMAPMMSIIRATPVLAIVIIALFWFPTGFVPIFSAVLMTLPIMATSADSGIKSVDRRLIEMAEIFRVKKYSILFKLRLMSAFPVLLSGARSSLGITWKVIIAGEILSQPKWGIGTEMQIARSLLEAPTVFAWTALGILLCGLTDWIFGIYHKKAQSHELFA